MPSLRTYQKQQVAGIWAEWAKGHKVVMGVLPTGGGKTVEASDIITTEPGASCAIAHRKSIVAQIALALARNGVRHRIIGPPSMVKYCQRLQLSKLGRHFVDPNARCAVASVDTLINLPVTDSWAPTVALWFGDEGHHFLEANKWGRAVAKFTNPNVRGLLFTATTNRPDGKGLGRHADGLADVMVLGPSMRWLIDEGFLVDYRVACPDSDVDVSQVEISKATGELNLHQLREAFHKAKAICGDTVEAWKKHFPGTKTICFNVDVEEATKTALAFRNAGISAQVVCAETPDDVRDDIMRRFEIGQILVLCNVDLFGEGFDLPNIETVIMARHTASFIVYAQEWGRGTRPVIEDQIMRVWDDLTAAKRLAYIAASSKPHMNLLDMVGNLLRHNGPPDALFRKHSLNASGGRGAGPTGAIPYRVCTNPICVKPYERIHPKCPYCGHFPELALRNSPDVVDGNVLLLDPATLQAMRDAVAVVDGPVEVFGDDVVARSIKKRHAERQHAQGLLRQAMTWWSGFEQAKGRMDLGEHYQRFYYTFGVDAGSAMQLNTKDSQALYTRIAVELGQQGIDAAVTID